MAEEILSEKRRRADFLGVIASGGPYDKEYADNVIDKIIEDYDKIRLTFKERVEQPNKEEIDTGELDNLLSDLIN
jgi:hypothetical protein